MIWRPVYHLCPDFGTRPIFFRPVGVFIPIEHFVQCFVTPLEPGAARKMLTRLQSTNLGQKAFTTREGKMAMCGQRQRLWGVLLTLCLSGCATYLGVPKEPMNLGKLTSTFSGELEAIAGDTTQISREKRNDYITRHYRV